VEDKVEGRHAKEEEVGEDAPELVLLKYQPIVQVERKWRDEVEVACCIKKMASRRRRSCQLLLAGGAAEHVCSHTPTPAVVRTDAVK
jgi:hypothetical protein